MSEMIQENREKDLFIMKKFMLGLGEDFLSLMNHVDSEIWFQAMKDESEEMYPFDVEVEVMPGIVENLWEVKQQSWFCAYLILFETVEDLNQYQRIKEKSCKFK